MTPTLRKRLEKLEAQNAPELPTLLIRMNHGEDERLVLDAWRAEHPDVSELGLVVITCVWGAAPRGRFVTADSMATAEEFSAIGQEPQPAAERS
jgi:hypothetical protein